MVRPNLLIVVADQLAPQFLSCCGHPVVQAPNIERLASDKLAALGETGLAGDAIVVSTSDHGDMLGERGMWFKMSYLEHSARVPLIVHAPRMFAPRRVGQAVSMERIPMPPNPGYATLCQFANSKRRPVFHAIEHGELT